MQKKESKQRKLSPTQKIKQGIASTMEDYGPFGGLYLMANCLVFKAPRNLCLQP